MSDSCDWLVHDHSKYEEMLLACVEAVEQWEWATANELFETLVEQVKGHMAMEEEVLYPAYESLAELPQEPLRALRNDHDKVVQLVRDLNIVLKTLV